MAEGCFQEAAGSAVSVLPVNSVFTASYFELNFGIPSHFYSALVMALISVLTSAAIPSVYLIFLPGEQMADNTKRNAGIGLSLCAAIVRAHGGTIEAYTIQPAEQPSALQRIRRK